MLSWYVLALPEARAFWRRHGRVRVLPEQLVDAGGQPALVTRFEGVNGAARLDVVSVRDTFRTLGVFGTPALGGR
jgi:hypothetical protein